MDTELYSQTKDNNLDLEFKKILCSIRQHVPYINSNAYLMQCRVWLEKLSSSNVNKKIRNMYLVELCKQIEANKLLPPFNEAPPSGDLKNLTPFLHGTKCKIQPPQTNMCSRSIISFKNSLNTITENIYPSFSDIMENWDYVEPLDSDDGTHESHQDQYVGRQLYSDTIGDILDDKNISKGCGEPGNDQSKPEVLLEGGAKSQELTDDDSWSDFSDLTNNVDTAMELQVEHHKINVQGKENSKNKKISIKSCKQKHEHGPVQNMQLANLLTENVYTNINDMELIPNFKCLKDTNYIFQDWKKSIAALQLRLSEMIQQNNGLNAIIQKLEMQLEDNTIKNKAFNEKNFKISENLHNQEMEKLNKMHTENLLKLERSYKANFDKLNKEHEDRIQHITHSHEKEISEIKKQNENGMFKKDEEISKLSEIIQEQCMRIMNDISTLKTQVSKCTCEKKVHVLKKCVSKMDKLFLRSEREYLKQIENLRQELVVKESALQMQLKIQKADLIAQTITGQKEEFEEILNSLEIKYIKMLEGHELQIMKMKKQDDEKIQYLSDLLQKNGISCDNNI